MVNDYLKHDCKFIVEDSSQMAACLKKASLSWISCASFLSLSILVINYVLINAVSPGLFFVKLSRVLVVLLLLPAIFLRRSFSQDELILVALLVPPLLIGGEDNSIARNVFFMALFLFSYRKTGIDLAARGTTVLFLALLAVFILLSLGVIENSIDTSGGRERATYGFSNTNAFSSLVFSFLILLMCSWRKAAWLKYLIFAGFVALVWSTTDNRALVVAGALYFVFRIFVEVIARSPFSIAITFFILSFPILFTLGSTYIATEIPSLDIALSFRPSFSSQYLGDLPWYSFLFGGISPNSSFTIDNSFLLLLSSMGVPVLLLLFWKTFTVLLQSILDKNFDLYAVILSIWFYCYSESSLVRPELIVGMVFFDVIFKSRKDVNRGFFENSNS